MNHEIRSTGHFDPTSLVVSASLSLRKNEVQFDQEFLESIENLPEISESIDETETES
jgi:hypothetical protein